MLVIDADTHVDECEETWKFLEGPHARYAPVTVMPTEGAPAGSANVGRGRWWLVDGQLVPRAIRDEAHHPPRAARELHDVQARLRDMDRLGVDVQVVFPTFFIRYGNETDPAADIALTGSYNRWLAEKCEQTGGRLRWAVQLPWLDIGRACAELRWAKEHGACGIYKRGYDLHRPVSDPYFFPVYEEAAALDMPLCIHTGHPLPGHEWDRAFPIIAAFTAVITSHLPQRFPGLRFGFIEAGASWIPYALSALRMQQRSQTLHERPQTFELPEDLFRTNRLYVALDAADDIGYLLRLGAEDNLMIGTDYCHSDVSAYTSALDEVRGWVRSGRITQAVADKILSTNPQRFYGL